VRTETKVDSTLDAYVGCQQIPKQLTVLIARDGHHLTWQMDV
jgi:hypothetical protein